MEPRTCSQVRGSVVFGDSEQSVNPIGRTVVVARRCTGSVKLVVAVPL